jgi:hypothetical protein
LARKAASISPVQPAFLAAFARKVARPEKANGPTVHDGRAVWFKTQETVGVDGPT